jgi:hypothetical protein
MAERSSFDDRLSTAVRALADGARTEVDAGEMAARAMADAGARHRPWRARSLLPVPVWLLVLLALLLAIAWTLGAGGSRNDRSSAVVPVATPTVVPQAPTPNPLREAHVSGSPYVTLLSPGQSSNVGNETRVVGLVYDLQEDVDDARVAGFGTLTLATTATETASMSFGSGTIQIDGAEGTWSGTCSSASWDAGRSISLSCWLTGLDAYSGLTYYRYSLTSDAGSTFDGVIISAPPPSP